MSTIVQIEPPRARLNTLPFDQDRGTWGIWLTITTESMLFIAMFAGYFYLGSNKDRWADHTPPELMLPFIMLAVLLSSSIVLYWGERRLRQGDFGLARLSVWITFVMGVCFLGIQAFEYYSEWMNDAPYNDSYGSAFYVLTTLHASHVVVGLALLAYIGIMPHYGRSSRTPHRPFEAASKYWHFVDIVWVFIVMFLYVIPHWLRAQHVH